MAQATRPRRRVVLADVAEAAGVSQTTASKALSGTGRMREETRDRVRRLAQEMGFSPNWQAQSLASGRTGTVGLITHDLEGRFSIPLLVGVEDYFGTENVSVLLCDARGDFIREQHHLANLLARQIDGVILMGHNSNPRQSLGLLPVPVVYSYAPSAADSDVSIITDDFEDGRIAAQHLIEIGRSRIALIGGDPTYVAARKRVDGALQVIEEAGLQPACPPLLGAWHQRWGRGAAKTILSQTDDVDGIICGSDRIARGAVEGVLGEGRTVPDDIAIVGYDNWDVLVEETEPTLTSVDLNLERLGARAAASLSELMSGQQVSGIEKVPGQLVLRQSTGF